ncbi:G-protein-signaling modulator 1 [Dirofilaria immitis]|nr:G-protein-signaling modulator 1 [Dirofilaria immitis]
MSVPLVVEGMDALALAQEGERLCRENSMKAGRSLEALAAIYSQLGNAYFVLRIFDKALEYHRHDLETAKLLNDHSGLAKAHGNIANTYKALGDFDSAYEHAVAHLRLAQELNDKELQSVCNKNGNPRVTTKRRDYSECEAGALYNIASVYHCRAKTIIHASEPLDKSGLLTASDMTATSQLQAAINCYLQNLHIVESMKDFVACGRTYGNIGNSYYMLGDYATAVYYHNKRLDIARRYGDRAAMRRAYTNLGNAHIFLSETAKALEYYRLALSVAAELHDEVIEAQCCFNVGNGAAICGDYVAATEYHTRYLKLARNLGDRGAESRACAALVTDFRKQGMVGKALYFCVLQGHISIEIDDLRNEESARNSLEDLLKSIKKWSVKEVNDIEMDSSADPEPHNISNFDASFKKLLCESELNLGSGLTRQSINVSTSANPAGFTNYNDDFFEMVSRLQSKRLNDQRCDPIILSDLTNHSKNITRQSDTVACNPEVEVHLGRKHRLSALFGRVGKAAKRQSLLMSASFFPPQLRPPNYYFVDLLPTFSDTEARNVINDGDDAFMPDMSQTTESPEFRIPIAPPRNRVRCNQLISSGSISTRQKNGAEGMLDLIASLQGRRMEEQRAHLSIHSETISLSINNDIKITVQASSSPHVEQSRAEDAGSLYEMVIRSQRDRLDEQRSELPRTMPVEDVSRIVMSMQKGRIETQRASL